MDSSPGDAPEPDNQTATGHAGPSADSRQIFPAFPELLAHILLRPYPVSVEPPLLAGRRAETVPVIKENYMKTTTILAILSTVLASAAFPPAAVAVDPDKKPAKDACPAMQALCPVSGEKIDPKVFIEDKSGKVYFCCAKCETRYKADPAKFATQVKAQRIALAPKKLQVNCPVCAKAIDSDVSINHHDHELFFCCNACKAKFEKNPAEYEKDILVRCYTTQITCPVSGEEINREVSTKLKDGTVVYFCCPNCIKRFESAPDKYMKNLALGKGANEHPCEEDAAKAKK